jgi:hypothetical protein
MRQNGSIFGFPFCTTLERYVSATKIRVWSILGVGLKAIKTDSTWECMIKVREIWTGET